MFIKSIVIPLNSLLIIAIKGDPQTIREALLEITGGLPEQKPVQGVYRRVNDTTQIITPVWDGKKY